MNDWITTVVKIKAVSMTGNNSDGKKREAELNGMVIDRLRETATRYTRYKGESIKDHGQHKPGYPLGMLLIPT